MIAEVGVNLPCYVGLFIHIIIAKVTKVTSYISASLLMHQTGRAAGGAEFQTDGCRLQTTAAEPRRRFGRVLHTTPHPWGATTAYQTRRNRVGSRQRAPGGVGSLQLAGGGRVGERICFSRVSADCSTTRIITGGVASDPRELGGDCC